MAAGRCWRDPEEPTLEGGLREGRALHVAHAHAPAPSLPRTSMSLIWPSAPAAERGAGAAAVDCRATLRGSEAVHDGRERKALARCATRLVKRCTRCMVQSALVVQ